MRIVEISDYSMTVMKDSDDPPWLNLAQLANIARNMKVCILVPYEDSDDEWVRTHVTPVNDHVCTAGRLILFFADKIPKEYEKGSKVSVCADNIWYY